MDIYLIALVTHPDANHDIKRVPALVPCIWVVVFKHYINILKYVEHTSDLCSTSKNLVEGTARLRQGGDSRVGDQLGCPGVRVELGGNINSNKT